jgi:hypothetical protein
VQRLPGYILLIGIQAGGCVSKNYLSAPTQAPTRCAEVGNRVEVGDEEEAENKAQTSLRNIFILTLVV